MPETDFKYDVAFSFLQEDEGLATQINDLLQDRYRTFLYSRAQEQLAGRDGEETFNTVFEKEARVVAVLFRDGWGQTRWTRIEETAIKNRGFDHGYGFVTFIMCEPGMKAPSWLPRTHIWLDLDRFRVDGAAAVLAARIQERGGEAVVETLQAKAERHQRAQKFKEDKDAYARSKDGVDASHAAHRLLISDLKEKSKIVGCRVNEVKYGNILLLVGTGVALTVQYECPYINNLHGAALTAIFYDGVPDLPGQVPPSEKPSVLEKWKLTFQLVGPSRSSWVGPDEKKEHLPESLGEFLLNHFMDLQQRELG
jgi:hypothetical protein